METHGPRRHILQLTVRPLTITAGDEPITVDIRRAAIADSPDLPLWEIIRASTEPLSYETYEQFMDELAGQGRSFRKPSRVTRLCAAMALLAFLIGVLIGLLVG
jgi:hypothetical protein